MEKLKATSHRSFIFTEGGDNFSRVKQFFFFCHKEKEKPFSDLSFSSWTPAKRCRVTGYMRNVQQATFSALLEVFC